MAFLLYAWKVKFKYVWLVYDIMDENSGSGVSHHPLARAAMPSCLSFLICLSGF